MLLLLACDAPPEAEGAGPEAPVEVLAIELGEPSVCDDPADVPTWREVGEERGLEDVGNPDASHGGGGALVVYDVDEDGDFDILTNHNGIQRFYVRDGAGYVQTAIEFVDARVASVAMLNGAPEFITAGSPLLAWHIEGTSVVSRDIVDTNRQTVTAQGLFPSDIDRDGAEDLFVMQTAATQDDSILWGLGDGDMASDLDAIPADVRGGMGFDAVWFDWDRDLDLDLYVVNDQGDVYLPNVLLENQDGVLVDASDACACGLAASFMGGSAGDFDQDGIADLYLTESRSQTLLRGGEGGFVDVGIALGISNPTTPDMAWGATFLDIENDGDLDIFEARGDFWEAGDAPDGPYPGISRLFVQDAGMFTDEVAAFGLNLPGSWRAAVAFDDNGDGVLDLLVTDITARPHLWVSEGCTTNAWLEVEAPDGARVEVEAGGHTQTAWVSTHAGGSAFQPGIAHIGLGAVDTVDSLRVTLTDGRVFGAEDFAPRRRLQVP